MKRKLSLLLISVSAMTFLATTSTLACFAVVVGKNASADGSVLVGHNEQNSGIRFLNFRKVAPMKYKKGETINGYY
jgi:dipeptidase